jgi:hypothetical protein
VSKILVNIPDGKCNDISTLVLDFLLEKIRIERFYHASARLGTPLKGQKQTKIGSMAL